MAQEQKQPRKSSADQTHDDPVVESDASERKDALDADVDDLLDAIDEVLEANAEEFVKSFIQKGGQ